MKSKEVIKIIQELDPTGEIECCINNNDIQKITLVSANYDGYLETINRNENGKISSVNVIADGSKIVLSPILIADILIDFPLTEIKYKGFTSDRQRKHALEQYKQIRKEAEEINEEMEQCLFVEYVTNKYPNSEEVATHFFKQNLSYKDVMPLDIFMLTTKEKINDQEIDMELSYAEKRIIQWERQLSFRVSDGGLIIEKKVNESNTKIPS